MSTSDGVAAVAAPFDDPRKRAEVTVAGSAGDRQPVSFTFRSAKPVRDKLNPSGGVYDTA